MFLIGYLAFTCHFLIKNYNMLDLDEWREKYQNFYKLVSLDREKRNILFYPISIFRRLLVIAIPTALPYYIAPQIICLVLMQEIYIITFVNWKPHKEFKRFLVEIFLEFSILVLIYHMICFTDFAADLEWQLQLGYQFIYIIIIIFCLGLSFSLYQAFEKKIRINVLKMQKRSVKEQLNMDNFLQHVFDLGKLKDLDKIKDPTLKSIVIGLKKKNKQKIKLS